MLKQVIYLIIASIIVILAMTYLKPVLTYVLQGYDWSVHELKQVFSNGLIGKTLTKGLPLMAIPVVLAGLVSAIYWMFKKSQFAHFDAVLWAIWIVLSTLIIYRM